MNKVIRTIIDTLLSITVQPDEVRFNLDCSVSMPAFRIGMFTSRSNVFRLIA